MSSPNGTDMTICKQGRLAEGDDGLLTAAGSFGNLPAGEAYLAPLEGKSHGVMVIEWGSTCKLDDPLRVFVENGIVARIEGTDPLRAGWKPNSSRTPKTAISPNWASAPTKRPAARTTCWRPRNPRHDPYRPWGQLRLWRPGQRPFHEDYVFYRPTLTLVMADGNEQVVIEDGRMLV